MTREVLKALGPLCPRAARVRWLRAPSGLEAQALRTGLRAFGSFLAVFGLLCCLAVFSCGPLRLLQQQKERERAGNAMHRLAKKRDGRRGKRISSLSQPLSV